MYEPQLRVAEFRRETARRWRRLARWIDRVISP
jgi:hypothetical protein